MSESQQIVFIVLIVFLFLDGCGLSPAVDRWKDGRRLTARGRGALAQLFELFSSLLETKIFCWIILCMRKMNYICAA